MGISKEGEVISIDIDKTKSFFDMMASHITEEVKSLKKGSFMHEEAGIEADEKHISIDLNKTEHFLDKWSKKMQNFAKEFDELSKGLDNNESQH